MAVVQVPIKDKVEVQVEEQDILVTTVVLTDKEQDIKAETTVIIVQVEEVVQDKEVEIIMVTTKEATEE